MPVSQTAKDVAQWLSVDIQRVYELIRRGLLSYVKVGDGNIAMWKATLKRGLKTAAINQSRGRGELLII